MYSASLKIYEFEIFYWRERKTMSSGESLSRWMDRVNNATKGLKSTECVLINEETTTKKKMTCYQSAKKPYTGTLYTFMHN